MSGLGVRVGVRVRCKDEVLGLDVRVKCEG